jgi:hypothetical protein
MFKSFDPSTGRGLKNTFRYYGGRTVIYYLKFEKYRTSISNYIQCVCIDNEKGKFFRKIALEYGLCNCDDPVIFKRFIDAGLLKLPCCNKHCWVDMACDAKEYEALDLFASMYKNGIPEEIAIFLMKRTSSGLLEYEKPSSVGLTCLTLAKHCNTLEKPKWKTLVNNPTDKNLMNYMLCACKLGLSDAISYIHGLYGTHKQTGNELIDACKGGHTEALKILLSLGYTSQTYYKCITRCYFPEVINEISSILSKDKDILESLKASSRKDVSKSMGHTIHTINSRLKDIGKYLVEVFYAFGDIAPSNQAIIGGIIEWFPQNPESIGDFTNLIETRLFCCDDVQKLGVSSILDIALDMHKVGYSITKINTERLFKNHMKCECMLPCEKRYENLLLNTEWDILSYIISVHSEHKSCWLSDSKKLGELVGRLISKHLNKLGKKFVLKYLEHPKICIKDFANKFLETILYTRHPDVHQMTRDLLLEVPCIGFMLNNTVVINLLNEGSFDIIISFTRKSEYVGNDKELCRLLSGICGSKETEKSIHAVKHLISCIDWYKSDETDKILEHCLIEATKKDSISTLSLIIEIAQELNFQSETFVKALKEAFFWNSLKCAKVLMENDNVKRYFDRI